MIKLLGMFIFRCFFNILGKIKLSVRDRGLVWLLAGLIIFSSAGAKDVSLEKFFQKKDYQLQAQREREIYTHESGLTWEFQGFNKLLKVEKYVYFFKELPVLKNNRIHITEQDFDFLNSVVEYYEQRKGIDQKTTKSSPAKKDTEDKPSPKKTEIEKEVSQSPPPKTKKEKEKKKETPSAEVAKEASPEAEESIDDLYSAEKGAKIDYVFIDPGHGGRDPGATFYGYVEKDLTLSLSQELVVILQESNPDFKIVLTRNDDSYLTLEERCNIANRTLKPNENGIFISVHLNVWVDPEARGIEVFYLTEDDQVIQKKIYRHLEDLAGSQEGYFKKIFSYLKVIQYQMESRFLSYQIIKNIESNVKASIPRGYKHETFYVLKGALMPAVLLELGFISNREDMGLLNDKDKRRKILTQVSTAVINYTDDFKETNGFRDRFYFDKFLTLE